MQAGVVCINSAQPLWTIIPQTFTHTAEGLAKWSTVSNRTILGFTSKTIRTRNKGDAHVQRSRLFHITKKMTKLKDMKAEYIPAYGCQICSRFPIIQIQTFLVSEWGRMNGRGIAMWGSLFHFRLPVASSCVCVCVCLCESWQTAPFTGIHGLNLMLICYSSREESSYQSNCMLLWNALYLLSIISEWSRLQSEHEFTFIFWFVQQSKQTIKLKELLSNCIYIEIKYLTLHFWGKAEGRLQREEACGM